MVHLYKNSIKGCMLKVLWIIIISINFFQPKFNILVNSFFSCRFVSFYWWLSFVCLAMVIRPIWHWVDQVECKRKKMSLWFLWFLLARQSALDSAAITGNRKILDTAEHHYNHGRYTNMNSYIVAQHTHSYTKRYSIIIINKCYGYGSFG